MIRPWIEVDAAILRRNLTSLQRALPAGTEIILVVAGNALGHGLTVVVRSAWAAGVKSFLVRSVEEALAVRLQAPAARVLLDGAVEPGDVPVLLEHRLMPVVVNEPQAAALARRAASQLASVACHILLDTGAGIGFECDRVPDALPRLARTPGMKVVGLCSRFVDPAPAEADLLDVQEARFYRAVSECRKAGLRGLFAHMADSAAILRQRACDMDGVRAGLLAYGYAAGRPARPIAVQPCLQWRTRVVQVTTAAAGQRVGATGAAVAAGARLGLVAAGYADGYPRAATVVLIRGRRCPVVGGATADALIVDLGPDPAAREGDDVVLLGAQGADAIQADELARSAGLLPQELLMGIRADDRREATFRPAS